MLLTFCGNSLVGPGAEIARVHPVRNSTYIASTATQVKSQSEPSGGKCEFQTMTHSQIKAMSVKCNIKFVGGVARSDQGPRKLTHHGYDNLILAPVTDWSRVECALAACV